MASGRRKTAAEGRFQVPSNWPKWKLKCGAKKRDGSACTRWAVVGMPTCKFHGSGGQRNAELGHMRYLAWIITGGPQNMPVEQACMIALAVFAEHVLNNGDAKIEQRMKAAMWLTERLG